MFTAKIIDPSGIEMGKEVQTWIYYPVPNEPQSSDGMSQPLPRLCLFVPNGEYWEDVCTGTVYIMNDKGKTVANYQLPDRLVEGSKG